ncbi:uncharacterized protein LOC115623229 isoform X2 [Scaptodrosophila lebanonensis]|uniref:Uncharacterized protein LOC115623229 isoform X2 n=1 Tax=Drosophila lebanonensis TaxID=7225 RepID=A0A6J2TDZ0_DROLE|nr:uncharacterized protein LOC115623229 isoform X2 [Scaptodrosophila lebanonensis]
MKPLIIIVLSVAVGFLMHGYVQAQDENEGSDTNDEHNIEASKNRVAAQLEALLEHYKQPDPVGFPGAPIPDPMEVPDMKKSLGMANLNMMQVKAYGLSKFRIASLKANLKEMKVDAGVQLDEMLVKGSYTLSSFFSKANGPFTVLLKNVMVKATATLAVERDGHLTTDHIKMDITFADMAMDFQNLGFLGTVFQGIVNSAPNLVFDAMKPFMLQEADKQLRGEINTNIEKLMGDRRLPNSITPLDMAIAEARKKVRANGYDPFHLQDLNRTMGVFSVQLVNTWINGISSFYRVGDVIAAMENNTVLLRVQVGTQQITGAGQWEVGLGLMTRIGHVQFTVQHIRVTVGISQSLDTRKRPQIKDLQIVMGNIQVRCDGAGTMDYVLEFAVNMLPNLLRYQIMDALENPIKQRVQEKFNTIDVEQAIKEAVQKYEKEGSKFSFDFKF